MEMKKNLFIVNGRVCLPGRILDRAYIKIENGIIRETGNVSPTAGEYETVDAGGRIVAPGFIDLHIQGAQGADILDATPGAIRTIAKACVQYGVTGFLATTKYIGGGGNEHLTVAAEETGKDTGGARLLGIYIEGPFISGQKLGMIPPRDMVPPSEKIFLEILALCGGKLRIMTVAPEIAGSMDIIRGLLENGAVPALGHTAATYEETMKGFEAGIRHVTHFFNAMPSMHHRNPGPIPAVFETAAVTAEFICDGAHLHPAVIRTAMRAVGKERCVLVTDGMRPMGLPDGVFYYEDRKYTANKGIALTDDGVLVGSATGMNVMLSNSIAFTGMELTDALAMASLHPARILGIEGRKGSLEAGKDADIVILNHDYSVWKTFVGGREVYTAA